MGTVGMTESEPQFREFRDTISMFEALARDIVACLKKGVAARGRASFVASGGTTPGGLYDLLSGTAAPWANVVVTLSDERWVAPTSDRSNEKLVRTHLLRRKAATARLVPLKTPAERAEEAEEEVHTSLAAMPLPFDLTLLGMGTDGHTASLIPKADGLRKALDVSDPALARAVFPPRFTEMGERMTLSLRALLGSRRIAVLIKGHDKLAAYRHAIAGTDVLEAPVRAVLHQDKAPVAVYWSP